MRGADSERMLGVCLASWMEPQLCPDGCKDFKNEGEGSLRTNRFTASAKAESLENARWMEEVEESTRALERKGKVEEMEVGVTYIYTWCLSTKDTFRPCEEKIFEYLGVEFG